MDTVIMMREEELRALINSAVNERIHMLTESKHQSIPTRLDTQNQLAEFLGRSVQCLIRWRHRGKIPFIQAGSRILFDREAVLKALEGKQRKYNKN
jgi:excisionase family DNA binding protein